MDSEIAALCAQASGSHQQAFATFGLALARLPEPHWSALKPVRPLRRFRLLELKDEQALTTSRLSVDERVLHYIAGVNYLDPRLRPLLREADAPLLLAAEHARSVEPYVPLWTSVKRAISAFSSRVTTRRSARRRVVRRRGAGARALLLASADIPSGLHELERFATLWQREASLIEARCWSNANPPLPRRS